MTYPSLPTSRVLLLSLVLCAWLLGHVTPLQAGGTTQLEEAVQKAILVLRDPALKSSEKKRERREKLRKIIYDQFDFVALAQGAVGRKWQKFSREQRKHFVPLFKRLLENTYMTTIERYGGGRVRFTKTVKQSETVIRADSVVESRGAEFGVSYRLRKNRGSWKVFDVIIEGVSVVSNYRSQFKGMLRRGSPEDIDAMLAKLERTSERSE